MASGVEELLDMLFDMVDEAKNVPLSSDRCMIERDRALDLIDDIRAQFPVELSEAKKVMASRADLIASAKREAEAIRRQAEEKAKQVLSEETILLQANTVRTPCAALKRRWPRHTTRSSSPGPGSGRRPVPPRADRPPPAAVPCTTRRRTRTERISVRHYDRIRFALCAGPSVCGRRNREENR